MWQDQVNAAFEIGGAAAQFYNCRCLYRARSYKGVSGGSVAFWATWGAWNLYYYPHLGQWFSFAAGIGVFVANLLWVAMAVYFAACDPERVKYVPR